MAVPDLHVLQLFHGAGAGHHPRGELALRRGWLLHQWLARNRPPACLPLRGLQAAGRPQHSRVRRAAPGARAGSLEAVGQRGQGEEAGQRVCGQSGRGHPRYHRPAAALLGGGLVQCRPSGPQRRHPHLGLRATGPRGPIRHEGALHHQRDWELREFQAPVAAHRQGAGRGHHVDGADHGQRHGALVSLARRRAGGSAMARAGARLFPMDRQIRAALHQSQTGGHRGRGLQPAHERALHPARRRRAAGRHFSHWTTKYEPHFINRKPVATVGVVFSQRMNALYPPPGGGAPSDFLQGMYYALLEGRFLFDLVHEDDLDAATLKKYAAVILPNTAILSDAQCAQLRSCAGGGGGLLPPSEPARYGGAAPRRNELGLADVFGASLLSAAGAVEGPKGNSYYARIEQRHAILAGFEETNVLPGAEYRLPVKARAPQAMTVVPPYPAFPPEMVYTRTPKTDEPAIVIAEEGVIRRIWLPGDVERSFWRSGNGD